MAEQVVVIRQLSHSAMMDSFYKFNTPVSIAGSCNCNFIVSNQILPTL